VSPGGVKEGVCSGRGGVEEGGMAREGGGKKGLWPGHSQWGKERRRGREGEGLCKDSTKLTHMV
jgi:hypothetical protein